MADEIDIKKAFEARAEDAVAAAYPVLASRPPMEVRNLAFDPAGLDDSVILYWRPSLHGNSGTPRTLGPTPREHTKGFFKIGVFARPGTGTDQMDRLAQILKAAYPYSTDLVAGGALIQIDNREIGDLIEPPGKWPYKPVDITWSIGI